MEEEKEIVHQPTKIEFNRMAVQLGYENVEEQSWDVNGRCTGC